MYRPHDKMFNLLIIFTLICLSNEAKVPGCKSLYLDDVDYSGDADTEPQFCFCGDGQDQESVSINCLFGSLPIDMEQTARKVVEANKKISEIYINDMEFRDGGLTSNFFRNITGKFKELTIETCTDPAVLEVDENAFKGMDLVNLTIIDCQMSNVPTAIHHLPNLQRLHISSGIEVIRPYDFSGMLNLRILDLSHNELEYIHPDLLTSLENLEELYISVNNLGNLNQEMFKGLSGLTILDLRVNNIEKIESFTFAKLRDLRSLRLAGNYISKIEADTFAGLENLESLDFGWNEFEELDPLVFSPLQNLVELELRHNLKLRRLHPDLFNNLINLKRLNLSETNLHDLPTGIFKDLINLEELQMSRTKLLNLNYGIFDWLFNLKSLDFRHNFIEKIDDGIFRNQANLKNLTLSNNYIHNLQSKTFTGLENLEILDLSLNSLGEVSPNLFSKLPNLLELDISNNVGLNKLYFDSFAGLNNLVKLNISKTDLTVWDGHYPQSLIKLKILDLSNTYLDTLPDDSFKYVPHLEELYLHGTTIKVIFPTAFEPTPNLNVMDISNNPWECEKKILELVWFIHRKLLKAAKTNATFRLNGAENTQCSEPSNLRGTNLLNLLFL